MKKPIYTFFRSTFLVVLLVFIGYSPVFYFNIYEDPFGIFTSNFSAKRIEPNNHFIKMRYLLSNKTDFNSFIFGNSRANNVDPKKFSNGKYFNMYYSLGVPKEHMDDINLLLKDGYEIKNVIVFLDYGSYTMTDTNRTKDMLRRPYPIESLDIFKTYIDYAFQIPSQEFYESYYKNPVVPIYTNMFVSGRAENAAVEAFIDANKEKHISDVKFTWPYLGYQNNISGAIQNLKDLKQLCYKNQINLIFVMNPTHKTTYLANNQELYFDFMKQLATISDYYDFSGINKITTNNYFYYEASHYRPIVGNAMADFIQYNRRIDSIPDFGFVVTNQNVGERILFHKQQIEKLAKP